MRELFFSTPEELAARIRRAGLFSMTMDFKPGEEQLGSNRDGAAARKGELLQDCTHTETGKKNPAFSALENQEFLPLQRAGDSLRQEKLLPGSNLPSRIPGNASTAPNPGQGQNPKTPRDPPPSGGAAASGESPSSNPIPLLVLEGRGAALLSTPWFFITAFPPSQTLQEQKGRGFEDIWRIFGVISPRLGRKEPALSRSSVLRKASFDSRFVSG